MRITFFLACYLSTLPLSSQSSDSLLQSRKSSIFGLPIVYVTPETSWAFGLAGIYSFYDDEQDPTPGTRPSQLQMAFAYTLNKQILFYLPYDIFTKANRYRFNGELGFYRYTYFYYGIGNELADYPGELFGIRFVRFRLNALRNTGKHTFLGLRYWMDNFRITEVVEEGLLDDPTVTGIQGGIVSGLGPMFQYDSRDNVFFPRKGALVEAAYTFNGSLLGSDFSYTKFSLNASCYFPFLQQSVLAFNTYVEFNTGAVPFNQLALLGGSKKLRGYYEGRFRDRQLIILQSEWRFPIWKRLKGAIFGGAGLVADRIDRFSGSFLRPAVGGGLRYLALKKEQIHVRFDLAWGQGNNSGFYLTIGEAF